MRLFLSLLSLLALGGAALAAGEPASADLKAEAMLTDAGLLPWLAVLPIVIPFLGSAITLALRTSLGLQSLLALVSLALGTVAAVALNVAVATHGPLMMAAGSWLPPFGIVVAVDQLSAMLVLIALLVGLIGLSYARGTVEQAGVRYGFYTFYLLLISGVCGAFSTGDIFNLYVWFEVFLVSSFGLIVHGCAPKQLDGAVKYGVLNLIATSLFLIAVAALYGATGTLNMADIRGVLAELDAAPVVTFGALFVLAFAMKAAAFPLHVWLPASYHTPRVVVSAVFAGLLTKVGVYCLMRIMVMLFGEAGGPFLSLLAWIGVATAIIGAAAALAQDSLKRMAAFLVVSGVGVMLIGVGLGTASSLSGAIVYTVHSILVMTALFLVIGLAERLAGAERLSFAGGLYGGHALAAALFLVFGLSASGLPPFSGFWPKLMLVQASLAGSGTLAIACALGVILSGFLTTIAVGRVWALVYLRPVPEGSPTTVGSDHGGLMSASVVVLAILVVGLGIFPATVIEPAQQAAAGLIDPSAYVRAVLGAP